VVDERLRVRGTEGLRVTDASIMPFSRPATRCADDHDRAKAADIILQDAARAARSILSAPRLPTG